jgi:hypothetical protein
MKIEAMISCAAQLSARLCHETAITAQIISIERVFMSTTGKVIKTTPHYF